MSQVCLNLVFYIFSLQHNRDKKSRKWEMLKLETLRKYDLHVYII